MSHFHKHPSGQRVSGQTLVVEGTKASIGLWGHLDFDGKELDVINAGEDLMITHSGTAGDSSIWTVTVKPSVRAKNKEVKDRLFANTKKWETWDWFDIVFKPIVEPAVDAKVHRLDAPLGSGVVVGGTVWSPNEFSLVKDQVFEWTSVEGHGTVQYFKLASDVVPNWFGAVVPNDVVDSSHVTLFFHPTPQQAGFRDSDYKSKAGGWSRIFHYLTDSMATQFCAARTGQIMIMPLMTQGTANTCGILPQHWETIFSQILGQITAHITQKPAEPRPVSSVVVASFSSGIAYNAAFRKTARLGGRLRGVIDLDGIISTEKKHSQSLSGGAAYPIVRMHQGAVPAHMVPLLATQKFFAMGKARWAKSPWKDSIMPSNDRDAMLLIHGLVPQTMMSIAADRTRVR